jgi:hypothetical protein
MNNMTIIWNVTECSLVKVLLMFRRTEMPPSSESKNITRSKLHGDHILLHKNVLLSARWELWYQVILSNHRSELSCQHDAWTLWTRSRTTDQSFVSLYRVCSMTLHGHSRKNLKLLISVFTRSRHWFLSCEPDESPPQNISYLFKTHFSIKLSSLS